VQAVLELLQRRQAEALSRVEARSAETAREPIFIPGLGQWFRAMPNWLARSSVFAPIAKGREITHEQAVLISRSDARIIYTGPQLDEPKADVWMQLLSMAKAFPFGAEVVVNRSALLRSLGRGAGGREYDWLDATMSSFTKAKLDVEVFRSDRSTKYRIGNTEDFCLLKSYSSAKHFDTCTFAFDPCWAIAFSGREYALIDWRARRDIRQGNDMAKALQRLVATSADETQRFSVEWLMQKLQYTSPVRKFRSSVQKAMHELERVGVIAEGRIEVSTRGKPQVVWNRLPKP
jgi:hypothetical protein